MMKKIIIAFLFLSVALFYTEQAQAQVSDLEVRTGKLENFLSKLPKMSGFINLRYQYENNTNSFDIRRARLDFKGEPAKWFDYRLQVDFASSPKIIDAFVRFKIHPMFNVQAGQFKLAFSLENPYGPLDLETLENSQVVSYLSGFNDLAGSKAAGRDIGVAVYGGFFKQDGYNIVDYFVGLYNGTGINVKDNNKHKDFAGRININPIRPVTLSAFYYNGKIGPDGELAPRTRYGFGARYDDGKILFRGEYIKGKTNQKDSDGFYLLAGYTIAGKFQPLFKYDYMRLDLKDENSRQINYLVGFDYWPHSMFRLQVNYTYRTFIQKDNNSGLLGIMLTARF
ncbi:MAG: porin [Bacteroidales bacterium]|jgi:phosphate-selective porin|nr:porin [Bacteroidales bacterium]